MNYLRIIVPYCLISGGAVLTIIMLFTALVSLDNPLTFLLFLSGSIAVFGICSAAGLALRLLEAMVSHIRGVRSDLRATSQTMARIQEEMAQSRDNAAAHDHDREAW